jgi:hypothetical protein
VKENPVTERAPKAGLTETLMLLTGRDDGPDQITLAEIVSRLDDQARGVLIILFALPNCIPSIPGTSAVTGLPLVFLTLQMALNQPPWLPRFIAQRSVSRARLADVVARAVPWLLKVERWIHPRLEALTSDSAERLVGILGVILSVTVMLPIPFGNTLPSVALIVFAMAFIGRDGAWVLGGLFVTGMAAMLLAAAGWAAFLATLAVTGHMFGL